MKQHINIDQLNELSNKSKKKYDKWYREHYHPYADEHVYIYEDSSGVEVCKITPMSIGEMIEFLDDGSYFDDSAHEGIVKDGDEWGMVYNSYGDYMIHPSAKELCDVLWQAVKEVLETP